MPDLLRTASRFKTASGFGPTIATSMPAEDERHTDSGKCDSCSVKTNALIWI